MRQRQLGRSGLTVSALGLGCMGMSEFYGARDEAEASATIHRALDLGAQPIDIPTGPMELRLPAIKGIGGAPLYLGRPIRKALVLGAGTGNDVATLLAAGASRWCWPPNLGLCAVTIPSNVASAENLDTFGRRVRPVSVVWASK